MTKVNAYEVAKLAHVSPATVSRAINHREAVNPETLQQVDAAMRQLGYELPKKTVKPIILVNAPDMANLFSVEVIKGINAAAKANSTTVLIDQTNLTSDNIRDYLTQLSALHVEGLITLSRLSENVLKRLSKVTRIVQCAEHNPDAAVPFVGIDDYQAALQATEYLISTGKQRLCLVNTTDRNRYATQRRRGFLDAVKAAGLELIDNWQINLSAVNFDIAYATLEQLFAEGDTPDGFLCISDTIGAALIRAAHQYHFKIPEQIGVVGFDNTVISKMTEPPLTTINVPKFQEGYSAFEMLFNGTDNQGELKLPTELIIRKTT